MKRTIFLFIILVSLVVSVFAYQSNVAVLKFSGKAVPAEEAEGISDLFCVGLVNADTFKVLDRAHMQQILEEQAFQMTGCTDEACAVEIGQLLNMDYMFTGSVLKLGSNMYITANQINVETGEIELSTKTDGFNYDQLDDQVNHLVYFFTGKGKVSPPSPTKTEQTQIIDLGLVQYSDAPKTWNVDIPVGFTKVETTTYGAGKNESNSFGGWNASLSVNNQQAWKFLRYDQNLGGFIQDFINNRQVLEKDGKGKYFNITSLIHAGQNSITYYHYTGGNGIGIKLKISYME